VQHFVFLMSMRYCVGFFDAFPGWMP